MKLASALLCLLSLSDGVGGRRVTVSNECGETIWPGLQGANGTPLNGGWEQRAGTAKSFHVPDDWRSARLWARTGCRRRGGGGLHCQTGDCGGRAACAGAGGRTPVSLAEFTLSGGGGQDWYDVSLVDGFNLPIAIRPSAGGCRRVGCSGDLLTSCPDQLKVMAGGRVVACKSACERFNDDRHCCRGAHAGGPGACPPTGYSRRFKAACPTAYSYAYDDASSLFTCPSRHRADYTVTFCPGGSGSGGGHAGTGRSASSFPCSQWGWRFMDGWDLYGNDLHRVERRHRNDCQPLCRDEAQCRAYSWSEGWCYLKRAGGHPTAKPSVYSAVIC